MVRCGYACLTIGVPGIDYRTCVARNASDEMLHELIAHNLATLGKAISYNIQNGILLFRISSDLIPFGSSPVNRLDWPVIFADHFARIGEMIRSSRLRVSMHPGQYTVLNSPRPEVVERAVADLAYHGQVLDCLGLDTSHKIILHIGGHYQDKAASLDRFADSWQQLDDKIRQRLVIENDDKCYSINEVLATGCRLGIPVVFDNLHHLLNHEPDSPPDQYWVEQCRPLWQAQDGPQKIHYSQQDPAKKGGSHSTTISVRPFLDFCNALGRSDLDIMLEVKDKNLSAIKCQLALAARPRRQDLEKEWARYKYTVLERAPADYLAIRQLLNDHSSIRVLDFYDLLEHALHQDVVPGNAVNAAQHVWGYFKQQVSDSEKQSFSRLIEKYRIGGASLASVKKLLYRLTLKNSQPSLMESYYFYL